MFAFFLIQWINKDIVKRNGYCSLYPLAFALDIFTGLLIGTGIAMVAIRYFHLFG